MLTTRLLSAPEFVRGAQFGDFTLLENIGSGGEGVVWSAYDNRRRRLVALKIISAGNNEPMLNTLIQEGFDRQVHLVASLNHPHILPTYEFGRIGTQLFFAMRYNYAGSIATKLYSGPLPIQQIVTYSEQIASALDYLHVRTIIHRDLKPGNILLDGKNRTYLTDFGLAKQATDLTMVLHTGRGTGPYASYEQHTHSGMMAQSDIFSFGIVLFEMLTGRLPWDGEQFLGLKQFSENAELPDIRLYHSPLPGSLNDVLRKMTALHWQDRPMTATEAHRMFVSALPGAGSITISKDLRANNVPGEDALLREGGQYLLDLVPETWNPDNGLFPLQLSHFAMIDLACAQKGPNQLKLSDEQRPFMLRGAFVHDHNLDRWWQENPSVETRITVCEQVMANEEEPAVARALSYLTDELNSPKTAVQLSPASIERLIDLAITQDNTVLRQNIFNALQNSIPKVKKWQPFAFSAEGDKKLALYALSEPTRLTQIARLMAKVRSETAVLTILDTPESPEQKKFLEEIYQEAGSWPPGMPLRIRLESWVSQLKRSILEDQETLSISRSVIGLLVGIFVSLLMILGFFANPNIQMRDSLLTPYPVSNIITIVEVNDDSLAREGRWANWPRSRHAELIEKLNEAGARVITFDFVFDTQTAEDQILAQAIAEAGNVVQPVLGQGDAYRRDEGTMAFDELIVPNETIKDPTAALGHTNILHDDDGYIRRLPSTIEVDGRTYPSIALASLLVFLHSEQSIPQPVNGKLQTAGREIPVDRFGEMLINYAGPPATMDAQTFTMIPYHDVLDGVVDPELLRDKIVFVGITATSEPDSYLTPVSNGRPMYGVEILANVTEEIWANRFITQPTLIWRILVLLLLSVVTGLLCTRPWRGLLSALGMILLYFLFAFLVFDVTGMMLDLLYPLLTITLSYAIVSAYRYSIEIRRRRQLVTMFQSNISPALAKETIAAVSRGEISLEGEFQEITVLTTDIRGFDETHYLQSPEMVMGALNKVRSSIADLILEQHGMIVQNDHARITAVFNAPLPQQDHPLRAIQTALAMQKEMNGTAIDTNILDQNIQFGYGVYTGKAIVGYTQNENQATYTAVGETVQISAQIAQNAQSDQVLIGETTYADINGTDLVKTNEMPSVAIRGRVLPVVVYEVVGLSQQTDVV